MDTTQDLILKEWDDKSNAYPNKTYVFENDELGVISVTVEQDELGAYEYKTEYAHNRETYKESFYFQEHTKESVIRTARDFMLKHTN